jgi:hypothetical protein
MWLTLAFPAWVLVVGALSCQRIKALSPLRHRDVRHRSKMATAGPHPDLTVVEGAAVKVVV